MISIQIPLKIGLQEQISFDSFVTESPETALALNQFQTSLKHSSHAFYLQGEPGVGKTHLLQAACVFKSGLNHSAVYLPLADTSLPLIADSLNGLEQTQLICIDDIETKMDDVVWQKALATLLVKAQTAGNIVVFSGNHSFVDWEVTYPDLNRALMGVLTVHIPKLSKGADLVDALQRHAKKRGFDLSVDVGNFLVNQFSTQLAELMSVLMMLEHETLVEKRRLTLPFVKTVLKRNRS